MTAVKQPRDIEAIGRLYVSLMEEIKRRTDVIRHALDGSCPMPPMAAFEFCYLQLRKTCEVFALACLTAHGDIPEVRTKLIQKTYNADQIIKQLTKLHGEFYPVPGLQKLDPITQKPVEVIEVKSGYLTKEDLLILYGECGNYLHRGSIRQLLTSWEPEVDFIRITAWVDKIIKLLNHHQIQTNQPDKQIWIVMQSKDDGRVHWAFMQRLTPIKSTPAQPSHVPA